MIFIWSHCVLIENQKKNSSVFACLYSILKSLFITHKKIKMLKTNSQLKNYSLGPLAGEKFSFTKFFFAKHNRTHKTESQQLHMFGFCWVYFFDRFSILSLFYIYTIYTTKMLPIDSLLLTLCVQFITKVKWKWKNFCFFRSFNTFCVWQQCLFIVQYMFYFSRRLLLIHTLLWHSIQLKPPSR